MFEVVGPSFGQDLAMSYAISQMLRRADQEPARSPAIHCEHGHERRTIPDLQAPKHRFAIVDYCISFET